ncbi:MAG: aldehyde dehydrogenase family protein [Hyphomonadaceae bacterium]|nr:aldehyde dehydrogenase family protein [Hyphomonadaceae bacterium]
MTHERQFYIDGAWVDPVEPRFADVEDPATEAPFTQVAMGSARDVDRAVAAAKEAFAAYARTPLEERLALLQRILEVYRTRMDDMARVLPREMGATTAVARGQVEGGAAHIQKTIETARAFPFERAHGLGKITYQPVGACALIVPWNNPVQQVIAKAMPALAAGCTVVCKPSELAPVAVSILTEVIHEAGAPKGVFNLLNGEGATVGAAMAAHPDVDMVSITGSVAAGAAVAKAAADTVKRVHQELGGKGPNIILPGADLEAAVRGGLMGCFFMGGQTCGAPTRMLVPEGAQVEAVRLAREIAAGVKVGAPDAEGVLYGPAISKAQYEKVQRYIRIGIEEGAEIVVGGEGRPEGLAHGYYCRPTVFANVTPKMRIAQEEIFGPVLSIIAYRDVEEAIRIANDSVYGLVGYVQAREVAEGERVARRLRCGYVSVNYPPIDITMPHGGFKHSGNGRQWGEHGLAEYMELAAIVLPPN